MSQPRNLNQPQRSARASQSPQRSAQHTAAHTQPRRRKKKKRAPVWLPLLIVLVILGGLAYAMSGLFKTVNDVVDEIAPNSEAPDIPDEVKTIAEYQGDIVGILITGIDYTTDESVDGITNDGLTDMIIYVQYDVKNGEMQMFQIPRNTYVGWSIKGATGATYKAANAQINSIVRSNKDENDNGNYAALADVIRGMYDLPIDYYASINLDALKDVVDGFGGLKVYIPETIEYQGSRLEQGYRILDGASVEFLVRNRKTYADGDISRLNTQRYFYAALFDRIRQSSVFELANMIPTVAKYIETSCPVSTMVSLMASFLKVDSGSIMICQAPTYAGDGVPYGEDHYHSVLVTNREGTAELLNMYFRDYTGPVEASALGLPEWGHGSYSSDANVQFMGQLDAEVSDAIANGDDYTEDYIVRDEFNQGLVDDAQGK